ncbi:MAG: hypothetical protein ACKVT1_05525 [Dehalococcoidia bacterium]
MSAKVSTFLNVGGEPYHYTFLLVVWNDYADPVRDELNRQADAFGADLGRAGQFVQSYDQRMYETSAEVLAKPWPEDIAARFANDAEPIILAIDRDFATFNPKEHPYAIIWLSDYKNPNEVRALLITLSRLVRAGEDLVGHLHDVAARAQLTHDLGDTHARVGTMARLASYVELKPSVFGVSIDLKTILRDIAGSRR